MRMFHVKPDLTGGTFDDIFIILIDGLLKIVIAGPGQNNAGNKDRKDNKGKNK